MLGVIDAGGTTFKCALMDGSGQVMMRQRIPTQDPETTLSDCVAFFDHAVRSHDVKLTGMGLACFGPLDVDPGSLTLGEILDTPKPGWTGTNLKSAFEDRLSVEVAIDTDVNAALLGEVERGAARGCARASYMTVGTGIGAGFVQDGVLIAKPQHPEFGHIPVKRHADDQFAGCCPFHGDCLEGMASAKAFEARWGAAKALSETHIGWQIEAHYLAQACLAINLFLRPERIILGGGLMQAPRLIDLVRAVYSDLIAGYLLEQPGEIDALIVRPEHGDDAGLLGAYHVARAHFASV